MKKEENFLKNTSFSHCDDEFVQVLLRRQSKYSFSSNNKILSLIINFLESTKHTPLPRSSFNLKNVLLNLFIALFEKLKKISEIKKICFITDHFNQSV